MQEDEPPQPQIMKMTLDQHRELAEKVKQLREALMEPAILGGETISHRKTRAVKKVLTHLDDLKSIMHFIVCADFSECEDAHELYYGMSEKWRRDNP